MTQAIAPIFQPTQQRPELLAPAGNWECAKAAVENGADAIYFGLERFNARMRANNFTIADLPKLMAFLHHRGVKGYVTFNTLVFTEELREAEQHLRHVRLEFVNESPNQVIHTIQHYDRLLKGEISGTQVWQALKLQSQLGLTRGSLG
ncbi:MAG: peptidase U32 family protein [Leptolyngbyaceae cyanobacterium]